MSLGHRIFPSAHDCLHITSFLRDNVILAKDIWGLTFYPCSVVLIDGIHLPCVTVRSLEETSEHFLKFLKPSAQPPESRVAFWVTGGTRVGFDLVKSAAKSRFALPANIYTEFLRMGEVAMSSNQCIALMKDGTELPLASSGVCEFYDFPDPYSGDDIVSIRRERHDSRESVRDRHSFDVFVTWPEEEAKTSGEKNLVP